MPSLQDSVDAAAEHTEFCGVVRLDRAGDPELVNAYGFADRSHRIANTVETLFAIASGSKGLTALTVMSLVERGTLELGMTARSLLGSDLPLIADDVTVEHLLAHRSGIGDYLDEDAVQDVSDYLLPVSVHELGTTEQFLPLLDGADELSPKVRVRHHQKHQPAVGGTSGAASTGEGRVPPPAAPRECAGVPHE